MQEQFQRCDLLDGAGDVDAGIYGQGACVVHSGFGVALEWCEDRLLEDAALGSDPLGPLPVCASEAEAREKLLLVFAQLLPHRRGDGLSRTHSSYGGQLGRANVLHELAAHFIIRNLTAAEELYRPGGEAGEMFVLLSGSVEIRVGDKERCIGTVRPGNVFGEIDWHLGQPRRYLARVCGAGGAVAASLSSNACGELPPQQRALLLELLLSSLAVQLLGADGEL